MGIAGRKKGVITVERLTCATCGKLFDGLPSAKRKYCSRVCADRGRMSAAMDIRVCPACGDTFVTKKGKAKRHCSIECSNVSKRVAKSPHTEGYWNIRDPKTNKKTLEHRVIAEQALGKPLKRSNRVHHVDENRGNNESSNLVLCEDQAYHRLLHLRARSLNATGNADYFRCPECEQWKPQSEFSSSKNGGLCKPCRRIGSPRFRSKAKLAKPHITFRGFKMTQPDLARHFGVKPKILWQYLNRGNGHTIEEAANHFGAGSVPCAEFCNHYKTLVPF